MYQCNDTAAFDPFDFPYFNQSTEGADGGGFLNFYKPLEYISSVLSFCLIFLDM